MQKVTVVIPIYKDWESISTCIISLICFLNKCHKVLLINDMSDEWECIEQNILKLIKEYPQFQYQRNDKNLGFVKTCNKAVFEIDKSDNDILLLNSDTEVTEKFLDEMVKVLYSDEKIGVVCPRSNNATFLSIPMHSNLRVEISKEQSYYIYSKINNYLNRMEEIFTGVGFAFLVKRSIIKKYGFFDEIFGEGYNEENDFCMRIRSVGYKIMKANHAYVYHYEGKSFGNKKERLEYINSSILLGRYPFYWEKVEEFQKKIDAVDYFADLLVNNLYTSKRILICIITKIKRKDLENVKKKIEEVCNIAKKNGQFSLYLSKENIKIIKKLNLDIPIIKKNKLITTFHLTYSLFKLTEEQKNYLTDYSLFIKDNNEISEIEAILKKTNYLDDTVFEYIRKRRKYYAQNKFKNRKGIFFLIKKYIYINHIWLFIWINKQKKFFKDIIL